MVDFGVKPLSFLDLNLVLWGFWSIVRTEKEVLNPCALGLCGWYF